MIEMRRHSVILLEKCMHQGDLTRVVNIYEKSLLHLPSCWPVLLLSHAFNTSLVISFVRWQRETSTIMSWPDCLCSIFIMVKSLWQVWHSPWHLRLFLKQLAFQMLVCSGIKGNRLIESIMSLTSRLVIRGISVEFFPSYFWRTHMLP